MASDSMERRLDPRIDVDLPLEVRTSGSARRDSVRISTRNLSASGALCYAPLPLSANSVLRCRFHLPSANGNRHRISTDAIVLRIDPAAHPEGHLVALYFVNMEARDREALRRFIFERLHDAAESGKPAVAD
jgi:c-di-GMP-binding flagellar brake protein YcgR